MKKMKKNCFPLLISLFLLGTSLVQAQTLKLEISLSDTTYYICQSIWLDVELTNISEDTVRTFGFEFPGGSGLNIVLMNEKGDTLKPVLLFEFLDWSGFILNPEETYYETFDLADIFQNYERGTPSAFSQFIRSLAPGRYEVFAKYYFRHKNISTPKISFEVIEPIGPETKALKLYEEAYWEFLKNNFQLSNERLVRIITNYPKSIYAEWAYWKLKKDNELLKKCPNSGYSRNALLHLTDKMSSEKKQEFLRAIIKQHQETRSAKFAQRMLRWGW